MSISANPPRIEAQPDTTTCGPTCLHALYRHFGDPVELGDVIDTIHRLDHFDGLLEHGPLAARVHRALGDRPSETDLIENLKELAACLAENRPFRS